MTGFDLATYAFCLLISHVRGHALLVASTRQDPSPILIRVISHGLSHLLVVAMLPPLAGLYLIGSGCYDLFIRAGSSRRPTRISVTELEKNVPSNRHLVVTGGQPVSAAAVTFYETSWGMKIGDSGIVFLPIVDASIPDPTSSTPSLLLRVSEDQLNRSKINFEAIDGIRTTPMDLERKARRRLLEMYDAASVDRMTILVYQGNDSIVLPVVKLVGGVLMVGSIVVAYLWIRKPKQANPPVPNAAPPIIGTQGNSKSLQVQ